MLDIDPHAERVLHLVQQWVTKLVLLPIHLRPELTPEEQARLGDYAVVMRYPGDYEPVSLAEAERAVKIARRVRTQVRQRLPKASTATPAAAS
jgi:hypothetical protein